MTRVCFRNHRGETLVGDLEGDPGEVAVVLCHGMMSSRKSPKIEYLSSLLTKRGVMNLRFDFSGRGESEGEVRDLTYSRQKEDLDSAIEYLASEGVERVGAFGSSMGGAVALLTAARDERISAIGTIAAVAYPGVLEERYPQGVHQWRKAGEMDFQGEMVGTSFLDDAMMHDVVAAVGVIRAPILVIHGLLDETVPVSDAHDIASAARNVSLNLVDGADHRFSNPVHMRPAMHELVDFFLREV